MTGTQKALCILLASGFLLWFAGSMAFEFGLPILGVILDGMGILSFLSVFVLSTKTDKQKGEEDEVQPLN